MPFYVVHPTTNTPDRLQTAMVVRSFDTAAEAFAVIDWLKIQLRSMDFRTGMMDLVVVDEQRRAVT